MNVVILLGRRNLLGSGQIPPRHIELGASLSRNSVRTTFLTVGTKTDLHKDLSALKDTPLVFSTVYASDEKEEEKQHVHELLEQLGFPYVGSTSSVLDLLMSKAQLKWLWLEHGINTPKFFLVSEVSDLAKYPELRDSNVYPLIVKPSKEGNSRGISPDSVVRSWDQLLLQCQEMFPRYGELVVETFLGDVDDIREFTVALVGNGPQAQIMPAEIILLAEHGVRVITTEDKEQHLARAIPICDRNMCQHVKDFARRAFQVAGVRDYARLDLLYAKGEFFAIEINGQPMVPDPWFEVCAAGAGFDQDGYISAILNAARER